MDVKHHVYCLLSPTVGEPIHVTKVDNPTPEQVDQLHTRYITALSDLFEKHKHLRGIPEHKHLVIS